MSGTVADVRAGVQAAVDKVRHRGLVVSEIVIPWPGKELFSEYLQKYRDNLFSLYGCNRIVKRLTGITLDYYSTCRQY